MIHRSWLKLDRTTNRPLSSSPDDTYTQDHCSGAVGDNLLTENVLNGDLDLIEGDVCGTGGRRVASLDSFGFYTLAALNQQDSEAFLQEQKPWYAPD